MLIMFEVTAAKTSSFPSIKKQTVNILLFRKQHSTFKLLTRINKFVPTTITPVNYYFKRFNVVHELYTYSQV